MHISAMNNTQFILATHDLPLANTYGLPIHFTQHYTFPAKKCEFVLYIINHLRREKTIHAHQMRIA
jgi:hypothetical protein